MKFEVVHGRTVIINANTHERLKRRTGYFVVGHTHLLEMYPFGSLHIEHRKTDNYHPDIFLKDIFDPIHFSVSIESDSMKNCIM